MPDPTPMVPANAHLSNHPAGGTPAAAPSPAEAAFERAVMELFEPAADVLGIPRSIAGIYAVIFASPRPLCFADIVERLEISNGSASQGLQFLRSLRAVRVVDNEGGRREYFEPELSLRHLVSGVLRERVAPLAATGADRVARLRELAERTGEAKDFYLDRVEQLETWRRRLKTVLPMLSMLLGPKSKK